MATRMQIAKWTLLIAGIAVVITCDVAGQAPRDKAKPVEKAAGKPAGKPAAKPSLKPGQIDLEKSRVYVYVGKKGFGHAHGVEGNIKSGSINAKGYAAAEISGEIVFDTSSFSADTDEARKQVDLKGSIAESTREQVTETMNGPDVLDVEKFPTATFKFKSTGGRFGSKGGPSYTLEGDLTLHGHTRPLKIVVEQTREDDGRMSYRGNFTILQSDYGIKPYKAALGSVGVADELKIWGDIWVANEVNQK